MKYSALTKIIIFILIFTVTASFLESKKKEKAAYKFKITKQLPATSVKHQGGTGTCWIFSAHSFLESEILRAGGGDVDLSEMFIARHAYTDKATRFVHMHGDANFSSGGQFHDVTDQIRKYGIVPENIFSGKLKGQFRHNHGELVTILRGFLDGVIKRRGKKLTPVWMDAFQAILDIYLGKHPGEFKYKEKTYTPETFFKSLQINMDDYIEITSYSHHPFYKKFRLEIPDNWSYDRNYYNVPMNELLDIASDALKNGYTFGWDADMSDKFFSKDKMDVALVPEKEWEKWTKKEQKEKILKPVKEKNVTQEMRQESFNNWTTTDDHLMHIIGTAIDQNNKKFFLMKNSWGTDRKYKGFHYISEEYFKLRTICLLVNKNSLTDEMKNKLGIK
ncbi:MAG: aminopeptidase [Candidatus Aminicenantes bacterium]|nr:aminopeptidase [Candidatus Aminicenantes bacterium]MCK5004214.1 aminopeptidase [Candidatus Aminicenantes bacterium]